MEEAKLLAAATPLYINKNGFVSSNAEVNQAIDRDNRLQAAGLAAVAPQNLSGKHQTMRSALPDFLPSRAETITRLLS